MRKDNNEVYVINGNIEKAISMLKARSGVYGIRGLLKLRESYPGLGGRKKAKQKRALKRIMRKREKR